MKFFQLARNIRPTTQLKGSRIQINQRYGRYESTLFPRALPSLLLRRCECCGTPFHENGDESSPGHVLRSHNRKEVESIKASINSKYDKAFGSLESDKLRFLQQEALKMGGIEPSSIERQMAWNTSSSESIAKSKANLKAYRKKNDEEHMCKRCLDIKSGNNPNLEVTQPVNSLDDYIKTIPEGSTIIHVIDAYDFPTTVEQRLEKLKSTNNLRKVLWVVNKADLVVPEKHKAEERALSFIRNELAKLVNADPNRILLVSTKYDWGLERLYSLLNDGENYFIGYANTGKTSLVTKLYSKFFPEDRKSIQTLPQRLLGRSSFPWTTQQPIHYEIEEKILVDMPSFPEAENGIYGILKSGVMRKVTEKRTPLLKSPGMYNTSRVVASAPNHLISIGGVVVLERNLNHLIAWPIVPDAQARVKVYSSLDKVVEWASKRELPEKLRQLDQFYHRPKFASDYVKKEFKLFAQGLTLAIRGLGIVHMHSYGKIPEQGITVTAHVLKNVKIKQSANIMPYLRDSSPARERRQDTSSSRGKKNGKMEKLIWKSKGGV